ncbi:TPA: hypothetical protein ACX6SR_000125 [Photobacterium damselae]
MALQRVRWNKVKLNYSLNEISNILNRNKYNEVRGYGFTEIRVDSGILNAVYSELNKRVVEIEDPFGNIVTDEVNDYNYIYFSLQNITMNSYLMSIFTPPKSLKSFVNNLQEVFNFSFYISSVDFNLIDYIETIKNNCLVNEFYVYKLKASSIVVNENSKAILELTSKYNALVDINTILLDKKYILERIKARAFMNGEKVCFEISKSGAFLSDEEFFSFFNEITIDYLVCQQEDNLLIR